jgi:uncharacterized RDD family membrane protein YckC
MSAPEPWLDVAAPPRAGRAPDLGASEPLRPAGFRRRMFAFLIDLGLVWLLFRVEDPVTALLARWDLVARAFEHTFALVVPVAYFVVAHGTWGRTAGKALAGVRVVGAAGERIGYPRAIARHFALVLSALPLLLGFLMVAARADKRALHDLIAGTRVVRLR